MSKNKSPKTRVGKRKSRRRKRWGVIVGLPLLIIFVSVGLFFGNLYMKANKVVTDAYESDGREKSELRDEVPDPSKDNVSVLIMGVDASEKRQNEDSARTDTLMLATLNKKEKSVKLLSIPRDSYVYIPEVDYSTRINHAHAYGGARATIETVENLLDVPVDYYVRLNFEAFMEVVDALNGINVDVPYELWEQDSKDRANAVHLLPGMQRLNGEEALALARTRKLDNDIERGKRQQEIIKAIMSRAVSLDSILKYDDIIEAVGSNMATNMLFSEMRSFISYGTSGTNLDIETMTLEGENYQPGNMYFWKLDDIALNETKSILQQHLEIDTRSFTESSNYGVTNEASPY